jgi:tetratricopeptide (TPR) repeat protein
MTRSVNPSQGRDRGLEPESAIAVEAISAPPKPMLAPPTLPEVTTAAPGGKGEVTSTGIAAAEIGNVPSPLVLQIEAAISADRLIEPKNGSAWDLYQQLSAEQDAGAELSRLKPILSSALTQAAQRIIKGDVRADNVYDLVDDFRRAGQMFSKARSLNPNDKVITPLEKLSAAQALVALQFYDEAERALTQSGGAGSAAYENTLGLALQGKLESFRSERAFKRACEADPAWATPHYNLAMLYRSQKNEASIAEFEKASELDPANLAYLTALGDEYFESRKWPQAVDAYRKAIALSPRDDTLHTKLGHSLYSQGLREEADREYQKARDLRGRN